MRKLEITNADGTAKTFELYYNTSEEEAITDLQGFIESFGITNTYERSPFQQGATTVALRGETRSLSFLLHIVRSTQELLYERVQEVVEFLNPYRGEVTIIHDNGVRRRRINAYYRDHQLIELSTGRGYGTLAIQLMSDDALFEDEFAQAYDMGSSTGAFLVPFTIPFSFGSDVASVTIENTGDYYNPIEVEFFGPLTDPELSREVYDKSGNLVQTDTLKFQGITIDEDSCIRVSTEQGREEATLINGLGEEENINRFLTVDSNYWQLFTGTNKINIASVTGNPTTQVRFRRKYIVA